MTLGSASNVCFTDFLVDVISIVSACVKRVRKRAAFVVRRVLTPQHIVVISFIMVIAGAVKTFEDHVVKVVRSVALYDQVW